MGIILIIQENTGNKVISELLYNFTNKSVGHMLQASECMELSDYKVCLHTQLT